MKRSCGCEPNVVQLSAAARAADAPCSLDRDDAVQGARRASLGRRIAGWIAPLVPVTLLAIMPKCPVCFAAYVALGAGIGLSTQAAAQLRSALIVLCVVSLVYLLVRRVGCFAARWPLHNRTTS